MTELHLATAGESHGPALTAVLSGVPSGLELDRAWIDSQLARRQRGYGRSARQRIETDRVRITGGVRHGVTLGSPVAMTIDNHDHASWDAAMSVWPTGDEQGNWRDRVITVPRPGHADLGGIARGGFASDGVRPVLERASARETAVRVAAGAVAQQLLAMLGVHVRAVVRRVGDVADTSELPREHAACWAELDSRQLRALDERADAAMARAVDAARAARDTLGGRISVVVFGLPPGLGGYATARERLDGRLASAALSVHAMKAVAIGAGDEASARRGSEVHDELRPVSEAAADRAAGEVGGDQGMGVTRCTNRSGGVEGGMTTGAPVVVHVDMKPLPTLMQPLRTVDVVSGGAADAHAERSDVCAVPAAAIVLECAVALELARVIREQFGAQALVDVVDGWNRYCERVRYPRRAEVELVLLDPARLAAPDGAALT